MARSWIARILVLAAVATLVAVFLLVGRNSEVRVAAPSPPPAGAVSVVESTLPIVEGVEMLVNPGFDDGLEGWWETTNGAAVVDGRACLIVPDGTVHPWDVQFGQVEFPIVEGNRYRIETVMTAEPPTAFWLTVQEFGGDYSTYFSETEVVDGTLRSSVFEFTASGDEESAAIATQFGGQPGSLVCIDRFSMTHID